MKILTEEQVAGHNVAIFRGAAEGLLCTAALAIPASFLLNRRWTYYRSLPLSLKVLGAVMIIAPLTSIQAERRGLEFDREVNWTGAGRMELDRVASEEQARWSGLSVKEKISDWASRHQYGIIFGSWALSIAVAGGIISRDRYQSVPQKVVQARVWAQGLTVGVLLVAGALTHSKRQEAMAHRKAPIDHSWQTLLDEQEKERLQQKQV
ncbi:hypothetical protein SCLCIDRAFT_17520 [Scleroderma citrinum Foug A]|uniref:HIG1 domain-containing protein n=1 Tax=Scleroderma citrinum Foug A TaxID=1036808 RepID=A0A0C2YZ84_9AGAM|nr:hypothetical protein SCLCIDRAFT_17520 [Scleroderma citrinum Foug A]